MPSFRYLLVAFLVSACAAPAVAAENGIWSFADRTVLERWIADAPQDALPRLSTKVLEQAVAARDPRATDREASRLALRLARMHLLGNAGPAERAGWHIVDSDASLPLETLLDTALANGNLDAFFTWTQPTAPEYAALKRAYAAEGDDARRKVIARNMERWRWMPRSLGADYVMVNEPRFEAYLWRGGKRIGTWRVIVGKKSTPTPVFDARITGVVLNPWWEIPASIVRESVGALVRRNPALARARGYVWKDGKYRQRPGPTNALGQMKLVMPNPFSVYMHDTPTKQLFERDPRAFSHGCIRIGDAVGFAAALLSGVNSRDEIDADLASGQTTQVALSRPIPVYVTYFTAVGDGNGGALLLPDIYNRDHRIKATSIEGAGSTVLAYSAARASWQLASHTASGSTVAIEQIDC